MPIQKFLFSSQSFTNLKEVKWNQTRRAIAIQEGVSIARSDRSRIAPKLSLSFYIRNELSDRRVSLIIVWILSKLSLILRHTFFCFVLRPAITDETNEQIKNVGHRLLSGRRYFAHRILTNLSEDRAKHIISRQMFSDKRCMSAWN